MLDYLLLKLIYNVIDRSIHVTRYLFASYDSSGERYCHFDNMAVALNGQRYLGDGILRKIALKLEHFLIYQIAQIFGNFNIFSCN